VRNHPKPVFHAPMLIRWTEDKLRLLDQDQLLNLLANLDHQRAIGRIAQEAGAVLERDIVALLDRRNGSARRKRLAAETAAEGDTALKAATAATAAA
jgi:hypothetical protein